MWCKRLGQVDFLFELVDELVLPVDQLVLLDVVLPVDQLVLLDVVLPVDQLVERGKE